MSLMLGIYTKPERLPYEMGEALENVMKRAEIWVVSNYVHVYIDVSVCMYMSLIVWRVVELTHPLCMSTYVYASVAFSIRIPSFFFLVFLLIRMKNSHST